LHLQEKFETRSAIETQVQDYIAVYYNKDNELKKLVSQLMAHEIED
jgi:uncharacterized protein